MIFTVNEIDKVSKDNKEKKIILRFRNFRNVLTKYNINKKLILIKN